MQQDLNDLKDYCVSKAVLRALDSVTLSVPIEKIDDKWFSQVDSLLSLSSIRAFHLYATGSRSSTSPIVTLDEAFLKSFITHHRRSLSRMAVLRFPLTLSGLQTIVNYGTELEELFITLKRTDFVSYELSVNPR